MNQSKVMHPPMRLPEDLPKAQLRGWQMTDGKATTQSLPDPETQLPLEIQERVQLKTISYQVPHDGLPRETDSPPNIERKLSDKELLTKTLARVCALQQQYGKTERELETLVEGFCWALDGYPMGTIIDAIGKHIRKSPTIPTPADIEAIINPSPPKIDWPLYIELKKRLREGGIYVSQDEKQFIRNCEDLAILRQRNEMENYSSAQRQLENNTLMIES